MKALAIVMTLSGLAAAGTVVTPPPGWAATDAPELARTAGELAHFGTYAAATIGAAQLGPATDVGVTLFATKVALKLAADPAAVRAEVDTFHGAAQRAQLSGSTVVEQGWQEKTDDAAKQVEATLAFHDTTNKITSTSRLVIVATADQLIAVSGECLARDDAQAEALAACKTALATLDPGLRPGAAARQPIALAPSGTPAPVHDEPAHNGPTISEGPRQPLPPMVIHPDVQPNVDRRPVFVGMGIVLLAAVFWWNMKRRARLEDEDQDE
ncbi:MAG: hypothetical protein ABI678_25825 [Kofleriaceae bacterium]